ncbi:MAG: gephyrin-like molybdotransferase Glp [Gaiellales bacterium]
MADLIDLREAQRLVLDRVEATGTERVPVERASGRVMAEAALARTDLPPFASSAMDGYAVRSEDTNGGPVTLRVVGAAPAGEPSQRVLAAGEAITISTGAVVPGGADAVVPLERVVVEGDVVRLTEPVAKTANIRSLGLDVMRDAQVVGAGAELGPAQVGALAAAGVADVQCRVRPRVGVLVTGTELRQPGDELGPGEIFESNGVLLAAQLGSAGAVPAQLGVVADDLDEQERTMERALLGFDLLVTSGGASVGPHDLVRRAQESLGVEAGFHGVAIKPGRPVGFGVRRGTPVFNLPGNPVSALVVFELLVRPAVRALLGARDPLPRFRAGVLASAVTRHAIRDEFLRSRLDRAGDEATLSPLADQESNMIVAAAAADALVHVPRGGGELVAGELARDLVLGGSTADRAASEPARPDESGRESDPPPSSRMRPRRGPTGRPSLSAGYGA